jgi:S1/P1 Nuclease.
MKALRRMTLALAALASLWAAPAMAWWDYGHRTVAAIAMANVTPHTRAAIRRLLAEQGGLDTPKCAMHSLEDAAVWPDCVKPERWRFGYAYDWHYQNMPVCEPFDIKAHCADGECVTGQIDRNARLLADRKLAPVLRLEALAFVVHFIGDVHQPLHVGENADLGGNRVKADYGMATGWNIHSIWDGLLAERAISSARPPLVRKYTASDRAAMDGGTVEDWARESWQISRDFIYDQVFAGAVPCADKNPPKVIWTNEMNEKAIPIVDSQIEKAGLRLAKLLDEALG